MSSLSLGPLQGFAEVHAGDDLAAAIVAAIRSDYPPERAQGLVLALAHPIVSKAEGAVVELASVDPGERAAALAAEQDRDARFVQVVLDQSAELLRAERDVLICRTHHGFVCANAGVDASNAGAAGRAIVLPTDPDGSARAIRARIGELTGAAPPAVLITDSFGRAWRHGQVDIAVGLAGLAPLDDWRGRMDAEGMELQATWPAIADAAPAAADLLRAKDSPQPLVVIEGLRRFITPQDGPGAPALLGADPELECQPPALGSLVEADQQFLVFRQPSPVLLDLVFGQRLRVGPEEQLQGGDITEFIHPARGVGAPCLERLPAPLGQLVEAPPPARALALFLQQPRLGERPALGVHPRLRHRPEGD